MMRRAEQHGLLLEWHNSLPLLQDSFRDIPCLVGFIAHGDELWSLGRRPIRPQVLFVALCGQIDDRIRGGEDWLG